MTLGITDTLKPTLQVYIEWFSKVVIDTSIVVLSHIKSNLRELDRCDGLVLTGGGDIHPKFYARVDAMALVHDVNERRDEFEFTVTKQALEAHLPILGICRGMQVFNVALSGTIIPDVKTAGYQDHEKGKGAGGDRRHSVRVEEGSLLQSLAGMKRGEVNTNHHQAVDVLAPGLRVTACSPDGIVEGLEWEHRQDKPFLQLVQWHPERMTDFGNPLSSGLLQRFVSAMHSSKKLQT